MNSNQMSMIYKTKIRWIRTIVMVFESFRLRGYIKVNFYYPEDLNQVYDS